MTELAYGDSVQNKAHRDELLRARRGRVRRTLMRVFGRRDRRE